MRTRKEKIEFLNGLLTGKRKLTELQPVKNYCIIQDDTNPDLYHCTNPDMDMTKEQLDKLKLDSPNSIFFMITGVKSREEVEAIKSL